MPATPNLGIYPSILLSKALSATERAALISPDADLTVANIAVNKATDPKTITVAGQDINVYALEDTVRTARLNIAPGQIVATPGRSHNNIRLPGKKTVDITLTFWGNADTDSVDDIIINDGGGGRLLYVERPGPRRTLAVVELLELDEPDRDDDGAQEYTAMYGLIGEAAAWPVRW